MADSAAQLVALDVGTKRIGVATANLVARMASPLTTLLVDENIISQITQLLTNQQAVAVVLGLPRGLDGQATDQTRVVQAFGDQLKAHLNIPLYWQDEALTSQISEEKLQQAKGSYQKADIDALAASLILDDFLKDPAQLSEVAHA